MRYCVVDLQGIGRTRSERPVELRITEAVGAGCPNRCDDVLVVQSLLNVAHARIRVPARTIAVDGAFGAETHAALLHFQGTRLDAADARVDPLGETMAALNAVAALAPGTPGSAPSQSPRAAALEAAVLARAWTSAARDHLERLLGRPGRRKSGPHGLDVVDAHFHVARDPIAAEPAIARAALVYRRIEQVLDAAPDVFREGGPVGASPMVDAPFGAFHVEDPSVRAIVFRPGFPSCGPNTRSALVLHVCAHFVGDQDEIGHLALECHPPGCLPYEGARAYDELTPAEALRNAASYTAFAIHAATGADQRFGARDTRL